MEYLGKLHQAAVEFPQTDIWMDSCGEEELEYGLKRGIVGATSNPIIVGNVIKNELNIWEKRIKEMVVEMKDASEEDIAWELIYEIGALRSKKLLPVFEANKGKKGRLSLQVNAKYYRNNLEGWGQSCPGAWCSLRKMPVLQIWKIQSLPGCTFPGSSETAYKRCFKKLFRIPG